MASWYIWSAAAGTASGADWTNAKTTLQAAITAGAAGDTYYVAHDHAETSASATTITPKGTASSPDRILIVNRAGTVPPVSADLTTGGSISTTGSGATLNVNAGAPAYAYWQGLSANVGSGSNSANILLNSNGGWNYWKNCSFNSLGTSATYTISSGSAAAQPSAHFMENCSVSFGNTSNSFAIGGGRIHWKNSTFLTGATIPTTVIISGTGVGRPGSVIFEGVDFSNIGSGKTLIGALTSATDVRLSSCKLGASVTVAATPTARGGSVEVINCDSGAVNYRNERYTYEGTLTTETVIIPSSQQASDGTTPITWKVVTTANAKWVAPFETFPYVEWIDATGSITRTFEIVNDGTTLTNAEVWVEVEYLGSSATPVSSIATSGTADILTTGTNLTTSSVTWTTTGLSSPIKQVVAVTFNPQMKGFFRLVFKIARASKTLYISPRPNEV